MNLQELSKINKLKQLVLIGAFTFSLLNVCGQQAFAKSENITIDGDHGKLFGVLQAPDHQKNYPLVIIMHGFTANMENAPLSALANALEKGGIASLRFDFNGHGKSEGRFQDMTVPNEIEDAKKVYNYAVKIPGVTSVSLAGHSQGGVVASMTAGILGTQKVKSLALMAPAAVLREDAIRGILFGKQYDVLNMPETVDIFNGLKLGANYVKTAQNLPIYETSSQYQGAALMVHGTLDTIVPYTYSLRYQRIYFNGEVKLIPGEDHGFTKNTAGVVKLVADFFHKQLK